MAFAKTNLTNTAWTLIGNNVTKITFQNPGQYPIYINATATNTAPTESVGLVYGAYMGESAIAIAELTTLGDGYVWARSMKDTGSVIVES